MNSTKLRIVLRTAYSKTGSTAPSGGVKKECELPTCNMRMVGLQYANGLFTYRIVFFRVFRDVVFVRNLYGSCLMPMRANKKNSGSSRLGDGSRSFYMFCVAWVSGDYNL